MQFGKHDPTAVILCNEPHRRRELEALVEACKLSLVADNDDTVLSGVDFVLTDLCTKSEAFSQSIWRAARYQKSLQTNIVVWTDLAKLDAAYAAFFNGKVHFLVDANDAEAVPILTGGFAQLAKHRVYDKSADSDFNALHRISDELAQFARTLTRIAEQDRRDSRLSDKPVSFRPAPAGLSQPFPTTMSAEKTSLSAQTVREMIKMRRLRDSYFASSLFADPAWDILLDLMASGLENRPVSVSSLCIAAAVPPTTALRWITAMTESCMLIRHDDPNDARRVFIGLSSETEAALQQYLSDIQKRSAPMV